MPEEKKPAWVQATDGQEKVVTWDSIDYVLPAGERVLFEHDVAYAFLRKYTINRALPEGGAELLKTVDVQDAQGKTRWVEDKPQSFPCPLCDLSFDSFEAVKGHALDAHTAKSKKPPEA